MAYLDLIATSAFGLEATVVRELEKLGIEKRAVENGRIAFTGDFTTVARTNLWLRCADRILIRMANFPARDFEELYQGTLAVRWEDFIPENGVMHVIGKSVSSQLHSVPACQSTVKKAVIEAMKRRYRRNDFPENGPVYRIEIAMLDNVATLTIDTSGAGLHKRGYREYANDAPLKETLAAGLIHLSRWRPERIFADPLCGSGTIAIEAALMGRNIAPGLLRTFAAEDWPQIPRAVWEKERAEAKEQIRTIPLEIMASDIDKRSFDAAVKNAANAGVADAITFQRKPVAEFSSKKKYGCIVTNPPYGERMQDEKEVLELYREMGRVFESLDSWSYFIMTSSENFERAFGRKADKNRKLYNGMIRTYLYQYLGPLPPRPPRQKDSATAE